MEGVADEADPEQTAWLVNPAVLEGFKERGAAERERRAKVRAEVQEIMQKRKARRP